MQRADCDQSSPKRHSIRPRVDAIRERGLARGWKNDTAIARGVGLDPGGFNRFMRGLTAPGETTIAGLLSAFESAKFEDLFERVSEPFTKSA